jgi:PhnB protein
MTVKAIPEGHTSITPYLTVDDGEKAIEFYKRAFAAVERGRMAAPDGKIAHAELQIGNAIIMLSDKFPQFVSESPKELGGTTVAIFLFVEDVDAVVRGAVEAGATITMQPEDQFWGDRMGHVADPFGHLWLIATRVEDLAPDEIAARGREVLAGMSS